MGKFFQAFIRTSAFINKEIVEVLRQPRLILSLIFGPFLILLLFGVGYRNEPRAVRTLFVAEQNSPLASQIESYATTISPQLIYAGVTSDQVQALTELQQGKVDLVAVAPKNAYQTIRGNHQAIFTLFHNEIDPAQASYIQYLGQLYVDEVNRRVISALASEGQGRTGSVQQDLNQARTNAQAMKTALQAGDTAAARQNQAALAANVSALAVTLGASTGLLNGIQQNLSTPGDAPSTAGSSSTLQDLQQTVNQSGVSTGSDTSGQIARLDKALADIDQLNQEITDFQSISPQILVRPFGVDTHPIAPINITALDFFTPAVIALLLQHIAVTIAALSIVRERRSGTMELFRVSPVTPLETILGKYISYLVFGTIVGGVLAALIYFGLHIPMLGSWLLFGIVALAVLFTSLGYGFVISMLAENESQAVQLAMIMLLLSVFFSGFLLDLRYFWPPIKIVSYLIPATYAINMFQDIMLRGAGVNLLFMAGVLGIGILAFILAWFMLGRQMSRR